MMLLFQDTETTGFINSKLDIKHPSQPRIVQLAAVLCDDYGNHLDKMNAIIKPDIWSIDENGGAFKVHGIGNARCQAEGIPMQEALHRFNAMKSICTHRVGYNTFYDKTMLVREAAAYNIPHDSTGKATIDVMQMARPICDMAPTAKMMAAGFKHSKNPKLSEAYEIIVGKPFENAHDAMADVLATMEIYFKIIFMKKEQESNTI